MRPETGALETGLTSRLLPVANAPGSAISTCLLRFDPGPAKVMKSITTSVVHLETAMKNLASLFLVLFSPIAIQAGAPTLKEARERLLRGNYAEARELFTTLAKEAKHKVAASIGLSRSHESEGQYYQALAVIDAARMDRSKNPDLLARRAEIPFLRGRWEE